MDAKQACDKLNGFNFQNRYLVGKSTFIIYASMFIRWVHGAQHCGSCC